MKNTNDVLQLIVTTSYFISNVEKDRLTHVNAAFEHGEMHPLEDNVNKKNSVHVTNTTKRPRTKSLPSSIKLLSPQMDEPDLATRFQETAINISSIAHMPLSIDQNFEEI